MVGNRGGLIHGHKRIFSWLCYLGKASGSAAIIRLFDSDVPYWRFTPGANFFNMVSRYTGILVLGADTHNYGLARPFVQCLDRSRWPFLERSNCRRLHGPHKAVPGGKREIPEKLLVALFSDVGSSTRAQYLC